jgi:hypothetical protein
MKGQIGEYELQQPRGHQIPRIMPLELKRQSNAESFDEYIYTRFSLQLPGNL